MDKLNPIYQKEGIKGINERMIMMIRGSGDMPIKYVRLNDRKKIPSKKIDNSNEHDTLILRSEDVELIYDGKIERRSIDFILSFIVNFVDENDINRGMTLMFFVNTGAKDPYGRPKGHIVMSPYSFVSLPEIDSKNLIFHEIIHAFQEEDDDEEEEKYNEEFEMMKNLNNRREIEAWFNQSIRDRVEGYFDEGFTIYDIYEDWEKIARIENPDLQEYEKKLKLIGGNIFVQYHDRVIELAEEMLGEKKASGNFFIKTAQKTFNDVDDDDFWDLMAENLSSWMDAQDVRQAFLDAIMEEHGEEEALGSVDIQSVYISPHISRVRDMAMDEYFGSNDDYEFPYADLIERANMYSGAIFSGLRETYPLSSPEEWGTTGYVLPDGTGLNLSEGYDMRNLYHRSVVPIMSEYLDDILPYNSFGRDTKCKLTLGTMGVMILTPEAPAVMLFTEPTRQQMVWIRKILKDKGRLLLEYKNNGVIDLNRDEADYQLYKLFGE